MNASHGRIVSMAPKGFIQPALLWENVAFDWID